MPKLPPAIAAAREAFEEAWGEGVVNADERFGTHKYAHDLENGRHADAQATVVLPIVENQCDQWDEHAERDRRWKGRQASAALIAEPERAAIVLAVDAAGWTAA